MKFLNVSRYLSQAGSFLLYTFLLTILSSYLLFLLKTPFYRSDFLPFYSAAYIFRQDPNAIYDRELQIQTQFNFLTELHIDHSQYEYLPYVNPPYFLLLFFPLTFLPIAVAFPVAILSVLTAVMAMSAYLVRLFLPEKKLLALLLIGSFGPVFATVFSVQNSVLTLGVFLSCFLALQRKFYVYSGLMLSVLFYKPQFIIPIFVFVVAMKNRQVIGGFVSGILAQVLVWFLLFPAQIKMYGDHLRWYAQTYEMSVLDSSSMVSLQGLIYQIHSFVPLSNPYLVGIVASVGVLMVLGVVWFRSSGNISLWIRTLPVVLLLVSGHVGVYEPVVLLFSVLSMVSLDKARTFRFVPAGWIIFLLSYFSPFYPYPVPFLPQIFLITFLLCQIKTIQRSNAVVSGRHL